nr:hypothetical protein [uncultured bacterium]
MVNFSQRKNKFSHWLKFKHGFTGFPPSVFSILPTLKTVSYPPILWVICFLNSFYILFKTFLDARTLFKS